MNNRAKCRLPQPKICLLTLVQVHCWDSRNLGDIQHLLESFGVENWRLPNYNSKKTCQRTVQIPNSDKAQKDWNEVNKTVTKFLFSKFLSLTVVLARCYQGYARSMSVTSTLTVKYDIATVALLLLVKVFYKILVISVTIEYNVVALTALI